MSNALVKYFSSSLNDKFRELTEPITDCFQLDVVMFAKIKSDGSLFQANTLSQLGEFYWSNQQLFESNPFIRHPSFYTSETVIMTDHPDDEFQEVQHSLNKFFLSRHVLGTIIKKPHETYWIGYSSTNRKLRIANLFLQERYILERFSHHLLKQWEPYFSKDDV